MLRDLVDLEGLGVGEVFVALPARHHLVDAGQRGRAWPAVSLLLDVLGGRAGRHDDAVALHHLAQKLGVGRQLVAGHAVAVGLVDLEEVGVAELLPALAAVGVEAGAELRGLGGGRVGADPGQGGGQRVVLGHDGGLGRVVELVGVQQGLGHAARGDEGHLRHEGVQHHDARRQRRHPPEAGHGLGQQDGGPHGGGHGQVQQAAAGAAALGGGGPGLRDDAVHVLLVLLQVVLVAEVLLAELAVVLHAGVLGRAAGAAAGAARGARRLRVGLAAGHAVHHCRYDARHFFLRVQLGLVPLATARRLLVLLLAVVLFL